MTGSLDDSIILAVGALMRRVAAVEIMPRFRNLQPGEAREKGPGDWVTVADEAAERALRAGLAALLPEATSVGEEEAAVDASIIGRLANPGSAWIIDPVDGTRLFRDGETGFGVLIALAVDGQAQIGWLMDCVSGVIVCAAARRGAFKLADNTLAPFQVSKPAPDMIGHANWPFFSASGTTTGKLLPLGGPPAALSYCSTVDYLALAFGSSAFTISTHSKPWDHAAGALLAQELGGVAQRFDGTPYCVARDDGGVLIALDPNAVPCIRRSYLPLLADD